MNTPTSKKKEAPINANPKTSEKTTQPAKSSSPAFLSSMPVPSSRNLGIKAFIFNGKKKIVKKEATEKPTVSHQQAHQNTTTEKPKTSKPASKQLIALVVVGLVITWALFWMFIFDFI